MVLHLLVDVEVGAGGASKPVSSLSTTMSSFIWPGSSMNCFLTCFSNCSTLFIAVSAGSLN